MAQETTTPTNAVTDASPSDEGGGEDYLGAVEAKYATLFQSEAEPSDGESDQEAQPADGTPVPQEVGSAKDQPQAAPEAAAEGKSAQILALARRESALRAREKDYETSFQAKVQEAVQAEIAKLRDVAVRNPADFYKQLGVEDYRPVANDLYYNIMGDEAPAEFRAKQTEHAIRNEIQELRAQVAAQQEAAKAQAGQAELRTYVSGLKGYVSGAAPESLPFLKAEFDADPDAAVEAMVTAASNLSQASGVVPSAEQVAEALNRELEKIADRYVKAASYRTQSKSTPSAQPTSTKTLSSTSPKSKSYDGEFDHEEALRRAQRIAEESFSRK